MKRGVEIRVLYGDTAGQKMRKIMREMPLLTEKSVRITASRHRRRLARWLRQGSPGLARKKELNAKGVNRVRKAVQDQGQRRRHIHWSSSPLSGKKENNFWKAVRYRKIGHAEFEMGFVSRSAEEYADMIARGVFKDPRTKTKSRVITKRMQDYFRSIGLPTNKTILDIPKRPVIDKYFKMNQHLIIRDINKVFNSFFRKFQRDVA